MARATTLRDVIAAAREMIMEPVEVIRRYNWQKARADIVAGLTVCAVELPQAMAYAIIAGVPAQYGLYASIVQGLLGSLFSTSEHLRSGPTNTQSLLVASSIAAFTGITPEQYLQLVFALALVKGIVQIAFAAAKLGGMVRYVSRAVFAGITAGVGILIIVNQLPAFLGISPGTKHEHLPSVVSMLVNVGSQLPEANWRALSLGFLTLLLMIIGRALPKRVPMALLSVIVCAVIVAAAGWDESDLSLVGAIPSSLPGFHVPAVSFADVERLIGGAVALAVLGMLESVAIAKSLASRTGERIDPNREFFSQGIQNIIGSFLQNIPGSGSFTRSVLEYQSGGLTRLAGTFNAIAIALVVLLFSGQARYIPMASLAGILFVIAFGLIDAAYIARLRNVNREDLVVAMMTLLATLLAPLQYAIFIGVFLNLALYIRQASRLHIQEMVPLGGGRFVERPLKDRGGVNRVTLVQIDGDLFFGVADELQDRLGLIQRSEARAAIFRLKRTHSIDSTVLGVFERFIRQMQDQGRFVIFCGVQQELVATLKAYGLVDLIGKENVFPTGQGVFVAVKMAIARAKQLLGGSIDETGIETDDETEEFTYEI